VQRTTHASARVLTSKSRQTVANLMTVVQRLTLQTDPMDPNGLYCTWLYYYYYYCLLRRSSSTIHPM